MRFRRTRQRSVTPLPDLTALHSALGDMDAKYSVESSGWSSVGLPDHHVRIHVRGPLGASVYDLDIIDRWAYLLLHDGDVRESLWTTLTEFARCSHTWPRF